MKLTKQQINQSLSSNDKTLVHFTAEWCVPCKRLSPVIDQLVLEDPTIKYIKIDVDNDPELASEYEVKSVPTLVAYNGTEESGRNIGAIPLIAVKKLFKASSSYIKPEYESSGYKEMDSMGREKFWEDAGRPNE
jgi:thioredoxin 1